MAHLSAQQLEGYETNGYVFPLDVLSEPEAAELLDELLTLEKQRADFSLRNDVKPTVFLPSLDRLVRHPAVLDAVESILGPDILCWGSSFFDKRVGDKSYVGWHQDSTNWSLSEPNIVTAWIALTPSTPLSGCMRVIPGTHTTEQIEHRPTDDDGNMLAYRQEIAVDVDETKAVDIRLRPGQMSLHHVRIFHGSNRNQADHPRIGFAIRYIPTRVRSTRGRSTAALVRGVDRYGHFDDEPRPGCNFDPAVAPFYRRILEERAARLEGSTRVLPWAGRWFA